MTKGGLSHPKKVFFSYLVHSRDEIKLFRNPWTKCSSKTVCATPELLFVLHSTCLMWCWVNILSKFKMSSCYGLGVIMNWRFGNATLDTWHGHVKCGVQWTLSNKFKKLSSSYGLGVMMSWRFGGKVSFNEWKNSSISYKLDGVGPVDNRPSPAKLHHFVRKKK